MLDEGAHSSTVAGCWARILNVLKKYGPSWTEESPAADDVPGSRFISAGTQGARLTIARPKWAINSAGTSATLTG